MALYSLTCRTCGDVYDLSASENHRPCPACGTENCRPQREADVGDALRRATQQRLRCDFAHAESSYQYVLRDSPDEHEALWGLVQCRYAVEYVRDPRTGTPTPIVHAVQQPPMLIDPDFREACELAPEAVREQYRREAMYIDDAMAKILALAEKGEPYDVFLCHKTTRTDGVEGYTEDFKRATDLYIMLRDMGHRVFFAPFAGLTPGESYEAGIYHALSTAKVMLVICSNAEHITSPWVRTEWQRFLRMSYEPQADKHLIPLLYEGFPPRRLPDDFRQLQAIAMGELNAKDALVEVVERFVGRGTAVTQQPVGDGLVPSRPAPKPAPAYAPESHFETETVADGVAITGYTGPGGKVLIPLTIGGQKVVEIADNAFGQLERLTQVVIPDSVTSIGEFAFANCSGLTSVSIPDSVTSLGNWVFQDCKGLTSVSIPSSVTSIGSGAFANCSGLTSVSIPDSVTSIGEFAFANCSGLTSVSIPDSVTSIGGHAFAGCSSLTSVSVPEGVTSIEFGAFAGCSSLTSVNVPASVTSIGACVFGSCSSLTYMDIPDGVMDIGKHAFAGCSSLTSVTIPDSVTSIADDAFEDCSDLTLRVSVETAIRFMNQAFVQPDSLTFHLCDPIPYAPENCFKTEAADGGVSITGYTGPGGEVLIPPSIGGQKVVEIGERAFYGQDALTKVVIPEGVTSIGDSAFSDCGGLASVSIPASVSELGDDPFSGCDALKTISVAAGNEKYYVRDNVLLSREQELVCYPAGLTASSYAIPEDVMRIRADAFYGCSRLTSVSIPVGMASIGEFAFNGCSGLTSVSIPDSVTSIGGHAFSGCSSLTSVSVPEGVTSLGKGVFRDCPSLTLRVHPNTPAHQYAQDNNLRFELIGPLLQLVQPAPTPVFPFVFRMSPANGTCALEKYVGPGGDVVIPETHKGYPVAGVWATAFSGGAPVRSILLPRSLKFLGVNLFRNLPAVRFRVYRNSNAHVFALSNGLQVEVID